MSITIQLRNYKGQYFPDQDFEIDENTTFSNVMDQLFNRIYFPVIYMELNFDHQDDYDAIEDYNMKIKDYISAVNGEMNTQRYGYGILRIQIGRERLTVNVNIFDNPLILDYDENTTFMYLVEDILPEVVTLQMVENYIIKTGLTYIPFTEIITQLNIRFANDPTIYRISDFDENISDFIEEKDGNRTIIEITVEQRPINSKIHDLF